MRGWEILRCDLQRVFEAHLDFCQCLQASTNHDVAFRNPHTTFFAHLSAVVAPHAVFLDRNPPAVPGIETALESAVGQQRCLSPECKLPSGLCLAHTSIHLQHPDSRLELPSDNQCSNHKAPDSLLFLLETLHSLSLNHAKFPLHKLSDLFNERLEQ